MGSYLNIGIRGFRESVNSEIYIDKTALIAYTNKRLNTKQKFISVSRPRRFGKSMTLEMFAAYYGSGYDSRELFKPYKIAADSSFEEHLNKYNVIYINMVDFLDREKPEEMIGYLVKRLTKDLSRVYKDIISPEEKLIDILEDIYYETDKQFIFLIDEWDCVMRIKGVSLEQQTLYLDFLRKLLKDKTYVALAYMTGILPIKKYGEHSALNMFEEYSMTNAIPII